MDKINAFKNLFELEQIVENLAIYIKRKLEIPVELLIKIDSIGDMAQDLELYAMANNDNDILLRMSKIGRGYLIYARTYYIQNKRLNDSVDKSLVTFSRIHRRFNPEICPNIDYLNDGSILIPYELSHGYIDELPNTENKEQDISTKTEAENNSSESKTFKIDVNKIKKLFSFLNDDIIACKEHEFLKAVATANFSNITILKKSKFQFMIFALGTYNGGMSKEWYLESAKSINIRASKCSGATVEDDYKKDLGDIIKKEFEVIEKHKKTLTNIG
jgi:hypothetical protein